jgi:ATP-binding cassette subfamily B protein
MAAHAKLESSYINTIQGISTIKSGNKENWFSLLVKNVYSFYQDKIYSIGLLSTKIGLWSQIISIIVLTSVIMVCSIMVLDEVLLAGQMMALISIVSTIMPSVGNLALANIQLQEARVAFDRMYEFASSELEYNNTVDKEKKEWEFRSMQIKKLSFRFPGRSLLLDNISFCLKKGEIITLFGEIGCGKSTLLSILQRFYSYDSGDILINDDYWSKIDIKSWRKQIATVPQQPKLFVGTLAGNIKVDIKDEKEYGDIINFCKQEGFDRFFENFQQGYMTLLGENGVNLSGGQQQLILLARALYSKPKLLLLDEPTSAMDRKTEQFVLDVLNRHKTTMGILLVTHRVQLAKHTNHIYILEKGTITANGSHGQLASYDNLYRKSLIDISM